MRVLVGCEESQTVCKAFLDAGHDAYSCDLKEPSGECPERHLRMDLLDAIALYNFDLLIAHPPCTFLCNSGVKHLFLDTKRWPDMFEAAGFFKQLLQCGIHKICIENPVPHKYAVRLIGRKYDQLIQPHEFSHLESKATCLWLKNLNPLINPTNLKYETSQLDKKDSHKVHYMTPGPERAALRSKTYPGIASEMARQWGSEVQTHLFEYERI